MCERTSVGATSLCPAATSIWPAAIPSSDSQSMTNRVNAADLLADDLDEPAPIALVIELDEDHPLVAPEAA